ncbi:MAG: pentapeptide repeat-containing protein [Pseudomonadota bacterium]
MAELKPANENPWYVLSTLHGEYVDGHDEELAAKNIRLWNIWSCQNLSDEEREVLRAKGADVPDAVAWKQHREEIEMLYAAEMKSRNETGFVPPDMPKPDTNIDMSHTVFSYLVAWKKAVFTQLALFTSATFTQRAEFDSATFTQSANFTYATFKEEANFSSTTFTQRADFNSVTFPESAFFDYATFTQEASFDRATFRQVAGFSFATFNKIARFVGARFGNPESPNEICQAVFDDAVFAKSTNFRGAIFRDRYPRFAGTVFHEKTQITADKAHWPSIVQPDPGAAKEACATLRHIAAKQSLPEDEYFFFRREMGFAGRTGPWLARPVYWLYGLISDYGYSVGRPLIGLFFLWMLGFVLFQGCLTSDMFCVFEEPKNRLLSSQDALGFSGSNIFKFFGFQRTYFLDELELVERNRPGLQTLAAFQTVFGYILLFFLGLGLRARFRLR